MTKAVFFLTLLLCLVGLVTLPAVVSGRETRESDAVAVLPAASVGNEVEYCSTDGPRTIPADNEAGITSTINVPDNYLITDLNLRLNITHDYMGDVSIYISRAGESGRRTIMRRPNNGNCSGNNLDNNIADDEASRSFENSCTNSGSAYDNGAAYRAGDPPTNILTNYDGQGTAGVWRLNFSDHGPVDDGTFNQWCLQFTVAAPSPTPTRPPAPTRTPGPTPTQPTLPTFAPTATRTPIPTPAVTPTPLPPGTVSLYLPQILESVAFKNCQTVEDETRFPNNSAIEAIDTPPLCINEPFTGKHNIENDREDIYQLIIPGTGEATIPVTVMLNVADVNLSLLLYNSNAALIRESNNPGTADEQIMEPLTPGRYFVRVYRTEEAISEQPYQIFVTAATN